MRGIEWRFLWQQCQPNYETSFGDTATTSPAQFSRLMGPGSRRRAETGPFRFGTSDHVSEFAHFTGFDDFIDLKGLAFSPDSQLLVAKGGDRLRGWRVGDWTEVGAPLRVQPNWNENNAVAFSPDGLTLATRMPVASVLSMCTTGEPMTFSCRTRIFLTADSIPRYGLDLFGRRPVSYAFRLAYVAYS